MVGVVCSEKSRSLACEFFELYKTPWEFVQPGKYYKVILVSDGELEFPTASLTIIYHNAPHPNDSTLDIDSKTNENFVILENGLRAIPIYTGCQTFGIREESRLVESKSRESAIVENSDTSSQKTVRIGYSLFEEMKYLLQQGQPIEMSLYPTLDNHIAMLRDLMRRYATPFIEIPPVPVGYPFTVCLSHDMDHPRIAFHGLDHTVLGFLYRATVDSFAKMLRGRLSIGNLLRNITAALAYPFMRLGWMRDCWDTINQYIQIERNLSATYFFIPFKGINGRDKFGQEHSKRASAYGISDVAHDIEKLKQAGKEIGVHGINSWADSGEGSKERAALGSDPDSLESGIRMHWLYFDQNSHAKLEAAGYTYDSTVGYNETVGYRAGTLQAYKPLNAAHLLEIPLSIMDTALFYPSYLDLSESDARDLVLKIGNSAATNGGILCLNWHDRSIAPERQWAGLYQTMIEEWSTAGAWFPTMGQAAAWFRERRGVKFDETNETPILPDTQNLGHPSSLPGFICRTYESPSHSAKDTPLGKPSALV